MMNEITLSFSHDDTELKDVIKNTFGDLDFSYAKSLSGLEVFVVVAIPAATLTIQLLDFLFTHFSKSKDKNRHIVTLDGPVSLCDKTKEEIKKEIQLILEENYEVN